MADSSSSSTRPVPVPLARRAMAARLLLLPLIKFAVAVILVPFAGFVLTWLASVFFQRRAETFHLTDGSSLASVVRRFPRTVANRDAIRLEELCAPLGIEIAPPKRPGRVRPSRETVEALEPVKEDLKRYVDHLLLRADDENPPVPTSVRKYLTANAEQLRSVRTYCQNTKLFAWEQEGEGFYSFNPNFVGLSTLERLFLAESLETLRQGKQEEVLSILEASWKLNRSIRARPDMVSFLGSVGLDKMHHRLVRTLPVPVEWSTRLATFDVRGGLRNALIYEASCIPATASRLSSNLLKRDIFVFPTRPFVSAGAYETSGRILQTVKAIESLSPCDMTDERLTELWQDRSPRWHVVGRFMWPPFAGPTFRVLRTLLDQELTTVILRVKSGHMLPLTVPSIACPGVTWKATSTSQGFAVEPSRRIPHGSVMGDYWPLPVRFYGKRTGR